MHGANFDIVSLNADSFIYSRVLRDSIVGLLGDRSVDRLVGLSVGRSVGRFILTSEKNWGFAGNRIQGLLLSRQVS